MAGREPERSTVAPAEISLVTKPQVVDVLAQRLAQNGVRRFFGVPGGDCSLDLIEACSKVGIDFVLARTEPAAAIMASVTAELTGAPGVVMATRGPGLANAANGVTYAALDRAPLLVLADGYDPELSHVSHQRYDQHALMAPLVKGSGDLGGDSPGATVDALLELARAQPPGPVYIEMRGGQIRRPAPPETPMPAARQADAGADASGQVPEAMKALLAGARRPIIIAGMQACDAAASMRLRSLARTWNCPVLQTYKSFGTMDFADPLAVGFYIGGVAEESFLRQADLVVLVGLDAIEFPPHRWRATAPVIELTAYPFERNIVEPVFSLTGPLHALLDAIHPALRPTAWEPHELAQVRADLRRSGDCSQGPAITPQQLVDAAKAASPPDARLALDAGAHMLPVLHTWEASAPRRSLISRGAATMGFALPAAVASALAEPAQPVIAFTGDGGLMMCAGELGTAVQHGCKLVVIVFNDASLTLIRARQERRQLKLAGMDFASANFAKVAEGFGCLGLRVEQAGDLEAAMRRAFAHPGVALVDVVVNPQAYRAQLLALRG